MVAAAVISRLFLLPLVVFASSPLHAFVSNPTTAISAPPTRYPQRSDFLTTVSLSRPNDDDDDAENHIEDAFLTKFLPNTAYTSSRRTILQQIVLLTTTISTSGGMAVAASPESAIAATVPASSRATYWPLGKVAFSLLPLAGTYTRRATVLETVCAAVRAAKGSESRDGREMTNSSDVAKGRVWTLDQIQGVVNVNVPVRMVVIKVSDT
jgi:hypothetical protein